MTTGSPYENPTSAVHEKASRPKYRDIRGLTRLTQLFLFVYGCFLVLLTATYPSLRWIIDGIVSESFTTAFGVISIVAMLCLMLWLIWAGLNQRAISPPPSWLLWVIPLLVYGLGNLGSLANLRFRTALNIAMSIVGTALLVYLLYRCFRDSARQDEPLPKVFRLWLGALGAAAIVPCWLSWRSIHFFDAAPEFPQLAKACFSLFGGLSYGLLAGVIGCLDRRQWKAMQQHVQADQTALQHAVATDHLQAYES